MRLSTFWIICYISVNVLKRFHKLSLFSFSNKINVYWLWGKIRLVHVQRMDIVPQFRLLFLRLRSFVARNAKNILRVYIYIYTSYPSILEYFTSLFPPYLTFILFLSFISIHFILFLSLTLIGLSVIHICFTSFILSPSFSFPRLSSILLPLISSIFLFLPSPLSLSFLFFFFFRLLIWIFCYWRNGTYCIYLILPTNHMASF